jgi:hypothetical protein
MPPSYGKPYPMFGPTPLMGIVHNRNTPAQYRNAAARAAGHGVGLLRRCLPREGAGRCWLLLANHGFR